MSDTACLDAALEAIKAASVLVETCKRAQVSGLLTSAPLLRWVSHRASGIEKKVFDRAAAELRDTVGCVVRPGRELLIERTALERWLAKFEAGPARPAPSCTKTLPDDPNAPIPFDRHRARERGKRSAR